MNTANALQASCFLTLDADGTCRLDRRIFTDLTQCKQRLRAFEEFFSASGMATPDDIEVFSLSQDRYRVELLERGAKAAAHG